MKKYCTNCGQESNDKICKHCGVKKGKTHQFCEWCGTELTANAEICTSCNEKISGGAKAKLLTVIEIILAIVVASSSAIALSTGEGALSLILILLAAILILPPCRILIKNLTHNKKAVRKIANVGRFIIAFVLFFAGLVISPDMEYEIITDEATKAAEIVFHEEVKLKNEDSFIINDSKVTYHDEAYEENENIRLVTVVIDYSAQNGFGGMGRETYTVKMLFDIESGNYYRMDKTFLYKE